VKQQTPELVSSGSDFQARSWQSVGNVNNFPETSIPSILSRSNTGISFSGGGSRAYTAAIGYLAGFHELGLMENIRYVVGVSGGSWATAVYSYLQHADVGDREMLGPVVMPEDIEYGRLSDMEPGCVRSYTNISVDQSPLKDSEGTFEYWRYAVQGTFLDPAGIPRGVPFSHDEATVLDIKTRNPQLADASFLQLRKQDRALGIDERPVPLFGVTLVGPLQQVPFTADHRDYAILEVTSLSAGVLNSKLVNFTSCETDNGEGSDHVGGLVEPFAFGGNVAPRIKLTDGEGKGVLSVPEFSPVLDVNLATSASSWYPGTGLAATNISYAENMSALVDYWAPMTDKSAASAATEPFLLGDGGGLQVDNMISLLQRKVQSIIIFCSTSVPLQPAELWDASSPLLSEHNIDFDIPAFFGVLPDDLTPEDKTLYDLTTVQVFERSEWSVLADQLQRAQAQGDGIVVTSHLRTVANSNFGIEAGFEVAVTWVYLGRLVKWEQSLSAEMRELVVPTENPEDLSQLKESGPFESFPNYETFFAEINFERANLLADLAGWTIVHNAEKFRQILS